MISVLINISNAKVKKINQSEEEPKYYYFFLFELMKSFENSSERKMRY